MEKNIKDTHKKTFFANLHFRVRDQKAYCDGHMDKEVLTTSCDFYKKRYFLLQDFLCGSVFLS